VAPDGTAWARILRAFAREVADGTRGEAQVKWYLGGIAGDELATLERIRRGQLDGAAGAFLCNRLAPSLQVTLVVGLVQNRDEANYVQRQIRPEIDSEFRRSGFEPLAVGGIGNLVFFMRRSVHGLEALRRVRFWINELDRPLRASLVEMGFDVRPQSLESGESAYDKSAVDGFITAPAVALAFQWSARTRYFLELPIGYLDGCLVVANRAFDQLPFHVQQVVRGAGAKFQARFDEVGRQEDGALLGGLFQHQGIEAIAAGDSLRSAFSAAARLARERLSDDLVPRALVARVAAMLATYRLDHTGTSTTR